MPNKKKSEESHLSILEAVEALSAIADIDFQKDIEIATPEEIRQQNTILEAKISHWTGTPDEEHSVKLITETFHVVHKYLRNFYKQNYRKVNRPKVIEGVKTIMVLVGEAAKKLDHYTTLFNHTKEQCVKNLKEYKQLQEFYLTRIAKKIDEGVLSRWIFELTKGAMAHLEESALVGKQNRPLEARHVYIDMESVKSDVEYELFFLRKEDGSRFFNPRLIRNIKLVADFGETISEERESIDPLEEIVLWQDQVMHAAAKHILQAQGNSFDQFFHEARQAPKRELVVELYKAYIALIMSANSANLLIHAPQKSCTQYFADFQLFLRKALHTRDYQRMLLYPSKNASVQVFLESVHRLCRAFFTGIKGYQELLPVFKKLMQKAEHSQSLEHIKAAKECKMVWSRLAADYAALKKMIKGHPNGPLVKVLNLLQNGGFHIFDPMTQYNLPNQLYSIYLNDHKILNIHMASPTGQEFIDKAKALDEFRAFLRSYLMGQTKKRHLLINMQDKTSWREHSRATALEDLAAQTPFASALSVVTFAKETEFYHQIAPYHQDNHAEAFLQHFKENLADENCGFYFPPQLKETLFDTFIGKSLEAIHQVFFSGANVLTVKNRLDFIEIFYLFLQIKILDHLNPETFSFTCKDGIDVGGCASTGLLAFIRTLNGEEFSETDYMQLNLHLYAPALLIRERIILPAPFERMNSALRRIEGVKSEMGAQEFEKEVLDKFGPLYKTPILKAKTLFPS